MNARQVADLYAAWLEADRMYRRGSASAGDVTAARAAYLAGRDWLRGRSLEEVATRSSLLPTEYRDELTVDLFGYTPPPARAPEPEPADLNLFGDA